MEYKVEELLLLVKELADSYTSKESTSITYEAAQQLMGAALYCIRENDLPMRKQEHTETGVILQGKFPTAKEAYDHGYRLVVEKTRMANEIYNDVISDFMDYGNRAYYETVAEGMPEFFKWYDPRLNPMNHILTLDYPVLEPLQELEGIDLIYCYLVCIQLEQRFLKEFPEMHIRKLLLQYHSDYEELIMNVCGVALKSILVNLLIGVKPEQIKYVKEDYETLSDLIKSMKKEELKAELLSHLQSLIKHIYTDDLDLYRYLANEVPNIAAELWNGAINNCLSNII